MSLIAREITEDEWRMIEAQRAAQVIVGGEPGSTYPWVKLAQEVVRLRSQCAGAVDAETLERYRWALHEAVRFMTDRRGNPDAIKALLVLAEWGQ
jgi:hypothetical protein